MQAGEARPHPIQRHYARPRRRQLRRAGTDAIGDSSAVPTIEKRSIEPAVQSDVIVGPKLVHID